MSNNLSWRCVIVLALACGGAGAPARVRADEPDAAESALARVPPGAADVLWTPTPSVNPADAERPPDAQPDADAFWAQAPAGDKDTKEPKDRPADTPAPTPPDPSAQRPTPGSGKAPPGLNPQMIGDFPGLFGLNAVATLAPTSSPGIFSKSFAVNRVFVEGGGLVKIAENQSPRPEDRVFFTYNYYNNLHGTAAAASVTTPGLVTPVIIIPPLFPGGPSFKFGGVLIPPKTVALPAAPAGRVDVDRQMFGVEKTFFDGRFSVGVEMPVIETQQDLGARDGDGAGDLSVIFKYALLRNQETGDVFSAGLMVTAPTGLDTHVATVTADLTGLHATDVTLHSTRLQPFVGYIWNLGDFYVHGFTSVNVPTDMRDVILLSNDVGVGYHLYKAQQETAWLSSVVPTFEVHVGDPLNHHNHTDLITLPDVVDLTAGVHLGIGRRSTLTLGVCTPVSGPRPFDAEGVVQFNWRF